MRIASSWSSLSWRNCLIWKKMAILVSIDRSIEFRSIRSPPPSAGRTCPSVPTQWKSIIKVFAFLHHDGPLNRHLIDPKASPTNVMAAWKSVHERRGQQKRQEKRRKREEHRGWREVRRKSKDEDKQSNVCGDTSWRRILWNCERARVYPLCVDFGWIGGCVGGFLRVRLVGWSVGLLVDWSIEWLEKQSECRVRNRTKKLMYIVHTVKEKCCQVTGRPLVWTNSKIKLAKWVWQVPNLCVFAVFDWWLPTHTSLSGKVSPAGRRNPVCVCNLCSAMTKYETPMWLRMPSALAMAFEERHSEYTLWVRCQSNVGLVPFSHCKWCGGGCWH